MIKSRYFCDRCGAETTTQGASFVLYETRIAVPGRNPVVKMLCGLCARAIAGVVEAVPPADPVDTERP